jgi:sugar lactone lactonase YvrE
MLRSRWMVLVLCPALCLAAASLQLGCCRATRSAECHPAGGGASEGTASADLGVLSEPVVLARGALIHGASGLRFDSANRLHVASVVGNEIVVIDPETGEVISTVGVNAGVAGPDDIAFGPDGSLYWTSFSKGEVGRITPDGTRGTQAIAPGVNGIAFAPDGRLFVTVVFMGDALYEVDPGLALPPRLVVDGLGFLNGIDWGPDGFLYGPLWSSGRIVKIDVTTGLVIPVALGFDVPAAVKFDSAGRLYVVEQASGEVHRLDPSTWTDVVVATLAPGLDNLAFDARDRLFVSHGQDGCIYEILSEGGVSIARTVCPCGMIAPGGVAVMGSAGGRGVDDGGEKVFVADFWTLRQFDGASGKEAGCRRHVIGARGGITSPFTVAADGRHLILTSWLHRDVVQVVDPADGRVLEEYYDFSEPINAIRFDGDLVVAERGTSSVIRMSSAEPRTRTVLADGLGMPAGLAAREKDLWVSDWATGKVLQVIADGKVLEEPVCLASGLEYPEGLAVDAGGDLLVVEPERGRLSRIDSATGEVSPVVDCLAPCLQDDHPTWIFNGVAVGPSGTIYVTNDVGNTLCAIPPHR